MTKKQTPQNTKKSDSHQDEYDTKHLAKDVAKDFVGSDDWKRSKTGYLTGYSVVKRSVGSIANNANNSLGNIQSLWSSLTAKEHVPGIPDGGSPEERFYISMGVHGKSESDLDLIVENTWKSSILYSAISAVGLLVISASFFYVGYSTLMDGLLRFAPLLVTVPLVIKHSYTNWMVRNKKLDSIFNYIKSNDILPKRPGTV